MIESLGKDKRGITHIRISGYIGKEELMEYLRYVHQLESEHQQLVSLYDFRDAKVQVEIEDLDFIKRNSQEIFDDNTHMRCAFLTSSPEQTAFGIYYKMDNQKKNIHREIFTSYDTAVQWLLNEDED